VTGVENARNLVVESVDADDPELLLQSGVPEVDEGDGRWV